MSRRAAFRPQLTDRLEDRVVLSGGARSALVHVSATNLRAPKIGAMGDSLTDEYRFYKSERGGAKNWIEILAATRRMRFGALSGVSRGEPRNAGYAFNWARVDATSDDMVANQLPGLANQVRRGQVNLVWISIGANDFLHYASGISPYAPPSLADATTALAKLESRAEDNLTTAVRTIMAANPNVKMALATLPDLTTVPAASMLAANPTLKPYFDAVTPLIDKFNDKVRDLAAEEPGQIAVVDLHGMFDSIQSQAAASGKFNEGSQSIDVRTPSNDPHSLYLADGVHIGTVGQGLVANLFVQTIDAAFNAGIRPLTPAEILRQAKLRGR